MNYSFLNIDETLSMFLRMRTEDTAKEKKLERKTLRKLLDADYWGVDKWYEFAIHRMK